LAPAALQIKSLMIQCKIRKNFLIEHSDTFQKDIQNCLQAGACLVASFSLELEARSL
jgi:hypothetical protein